MTPILRTVVPGLILVLFSLLVTGTLLNNERYFYYPSLISLYSFLVIAPVFAGIAGLCLLGKIKTTRPEFPYSILFFLLWTTYVLLHGVFLNEVGSRHLYLATGSLLALSFFILIKNTAFPTVPVLLLIAMAGLGDCVLVFAQLAGLTKSLNPYFAATGSWVNPNVTAMFLVMCLPALLYLLFQFKRNGVLRVTILSLFGLSLILLKCRTAYIGTLIISLIILDHYYKLWSKVTYKPNRKTTFTLTAIAVVILLPVILGQYHSKKASADGRLFIWKVSLDMIAEKPLTGYGYSKFAVEYNLHQANFIEAGRATERETQNAGFVRMAYNEFLESIIEGGIPGLILFGTFLVSIIKRKKTAGCPKSEEAATKAQPLPVFAYAGVCGFIGMSVVNFTLTAIPAFCLFTVYIAFASLNNSYYNLRPAASDVNLRKLLVVATGCIVLVLGFSSAVYHTNYTHAQMQNKKAAQLIDSGEYVKAKEILNELKITLNHSESYWLNCGYLAIRTKHFPHAVYAFSQAKKLSSDPEIYYMLGKSYEENGDLVSAAKQYSTARLIEPTRFKHRAALMNMYLRAKDRNKAGMYAREIINLKSKIKSNEVAQYKKLAANVLKSLGIEHNNDKILPNYIFH